MEHDYMTVAGMAEKLHVSEGTVRRYASLGIIGRYQPGGPGAAVRYYLIDNPKEEFRHEDGRCEH